MPHRSALDLHEMYARLGGGVPFVGPRPPINTTISPRPALRFNRSPPRMGLPARPLMSFLIRSSRRFPVCCPVTYQCGDFEGHGTVWNLSLTGWRFSGNLPLRIGEVCSLTVNLPTQETLYVAAGIVRWMRGEEYGVETLMMDDESREDLEQYICQRVEDKRIEIRHGGRLDRAIKKWTEILKDSHT